MTTRWHLLLPTFLVLASCYKDEVDVAALTTNPLDPAYAGAPLFQVLADSTYSPAAGVYVHYLRMRVDADRFPSSTVYQVRVLDLEDGSTTYLPQTAPGADIFAYFNSGVTLGTDYCYDLSVWIELSSGRTERHCGTAQL